MLAFSLAIFTGAFLLFLVQPLIAKFILPWFGGTPAVWTACMLFFQAGLLGGYAYAHWSISRFTPRKQVIVHLVLLGAALLLLPVAPGNFWKPPDGTAPLGRILLLLTACLGLPYLVLSATGPLMQAWFSRARPGASPYRLYALSNIGSLLALVSYPFLVEPNFSRQAQANYWSIGLGVFALLAGWCGWIVWKRASSPLAPPMETPVVTGVEPAPEPVMKGRWLWFALPACGCVLLLSVTNKLCYDIAVIPFLWVLPLSLYLLSFIISFDNPRWYWRPLWLPLLALALAAGLWTTLGADISLPTESSLKPLRWLYQHPLAWLCEHASSLSLFKSIAIHLGVLFIGCMVCHGEVYRLRPPASRLTGYYLAIAAGGVAGGLFVAAIAPRLFSGYFEWHCGLFAVGLLAALALFRDETSPLHGGPVFYAEGNEFALLQPETTPRHRGRLIGFWLPVALALLVLFAGLIYDSALNVRGAVAMRRNFYGVLKVEEWNEDDPHWHKYTLLHGTTTHGLQYVDSERRRQPSSYYVASSGVGLVMQHYPVTPRRVAVVGLGTGSMAAWGREGDTFRFYEINQAVEQLARSRFTYLADSAARIEVVPGDARLSMEREPRQNYDVMVLDAFSSDAIPVHLLTREAFAIYQRHLKPTGVLVVHISNKYLGLEPVVLNAAKHFRYTPAIISNTESSGGDGDEESYDFYHSDWVLLSRNQEFLGLTPIVNAKTEPGTNAPAIKLWTDDQSDLFRILVLDDDGWLAWLRRKLL